MENYQLDRELLKRIDVEAVQATFMRKVYAWMGLALLVTAFVAYFVAITPAIWQTIMNTRFLFIGLILAELGLVIAISRAINKISSGVAMALFFLYAALSGVTFGVILLGYTGNSIASAFIVTAGTFSVMSAIGYFTKTDLSKMGSLLMMAVVGLIIATVVNMFLASSALYWIINYAGVLIFVGLTAYDTQKIKHMALIDVAGGEMAKKGAIMGALTLYLDFINLFLFLLRIFDRD